MRSVPLDHYGDRPDRDYQFVKGNAREHMFRGRAPDHGARMTQQEVANHLGISRGLVGDYERSALRKIKAALLEEGGESCEPNQ